MARALFHHRLTWVPVVQCNGGCNVRGARVVCQLGSLVLLGWFLWFGCRAIHWPDCKTLEVVLAEKIGTLYGPSRPFAKASLSLAGSRLVDSAPVPRRQRRRLYGKEVSDWKRNKCKLKVELISKPKKERERASE